MLVEGFSALQRAEIAEIDRETKDYAVEYRVSVLFNEPKLLKSPPVNNNPTVRHGFSALQRAEIAEMLRCGTGAARRVGFQCSSTSRNC